MSFDRFSMKIRAKELLMSTQQQPRPLVVSALYAAMSWLITYLSGRITQTALPFDVGAYLRGSSLIDAVDWSAMTPFAGLLLTALEVVSTVLAAGFIIYLMEVYRQHPASYSNLFDGFIIFFRVLVLSILMDLICSLLTFLLIIPGIIAGYAYRQALFLLVDHPDWSPVRCLRESRLMMRGHKWELFVLDLSFLGWSIACVFAPLVIFVAPYMRLTYIGFYELLCGNAAYTGSGYDSSRDMDEKPPWEY